MSDDIVEFIQEQLNADEAAGNHLLDWTKHPNPTKPADSFAACMTDPIIGPFNGRTPHTNIQTGMNIVHIADPARVLAEVAAKRAILAVHTLVTRVEFDQDDESVVNGGYCDPCHMIDGFPYGDWPCDTLKWMAAPYAGRPGFKDEWRVP